MRTIDHSLWLRKIAPNLRPAGKEDEVQSHTSSGPCPVNFSTPLRIIYDHELIMYRDCTCSIEFGDREYICRPDTFIILPPGKWHSELCLHSRQGRRYWCHFDWQFHSVRADSPVMTFSTRRPRYEFCRPAPHFIPFKVYQGTLPNPGKAYQLGNRLRTLTSRGTPHGMLLAGAVLHQLLIELFHAPGQETGPVFEPDSENLPLASRIRSSLDLIALQSQRKMKVSQAFSALGYSYEHICRIFKKAYGVSPVHYIHAQQMTRAKALLKSSDMTVAEICFAVGMNSPPYFAKTFRALLGMTPTEYRATSYEESLHRQRGAMRPAIDP